MVYGVLEGVLVTLKRFLEGAGRDLGVLMGFYAITPKPCARQQMVGTGWDSTATGTPQENGVKGPEGTAGSCVREV